MIKQWIALSLAYGLQSEISLNSLEVHGSIVLYILAFGTIHLLNGNKPVIRKLAAIENL